MKLKPMRLTRRKLFFALFLLAFHSGAELVAPVLPPAYAGQVVFEAMPATPFNHNAFAYVLQRFVSPSGYVAWPSLKAFSRPLSSYFRLLAMASPASHPKLFPKSEDALCYWLNVWFAMQLQQAVYNYGFPPALSAANAKKQQPTYLLGGQLYQAQQVKQTLLQAPAVAASPSLQQLLQLETGFQWPFPSEPFMPENLNKRLQAPSHTASKLHYLKQ
jgi:hypothetical protein